AQSRHPDRVGECPLSGVKRTSQYNRAMSGFDPKRTWRLMARMSANEPICDMGDPNLLRYTTAVPSAFLFAVGA
ncbi:MAG TPA: hypothetical protein VGU64_02815, partial [Terriglobales bacterium]|nr:hypothetical protein [Terriglobales bacterium]